MHGPKEIPPPYPPFFRGEALGGESRAGLPLTKFRKILDHDQLK